MSFLHAAPEAAFHDVTSGDNSVSFPPRTISGYQAKAGWDRSRAGAAPTLAS